ncbi:heme exporter protein D [Tistlia consotensis]|uniref:Heme exporter protein D n=1 Tax=Tistlia consotensis USBA 355 TaxID=560819 RepID=A0A1Y6BHS1_9PROT|nr:heme exporter protein CcmD [Tistlia consotensis]SMF11852.1 heme exporter protein D [Tistlia consotensis USBA 355]SNR51600.1 heme exporter protein D [Tistlia consotensis]
MGSLDDFLAMGGYAVYVWPAYLLAAIVLIGLFAVSRAELRRRERHLQALERSRGAAGHRRRRGGDAR